MTLVQLNSHTVGEAFDALLACCGSRRWAEKMATARPFAESESLHRLADVFWTELDYEDCREAFSKCPRIGEHTSSIWSQQEQSGMRHASQSLQQAMEKLNQKYEAHFGWTFIIYATGRSADQLHDALLRRITNDHATELQLTASEQAKIMHLRLDKLLAQ